MTDTRVRMVKDGAFPVNQALAGLVPMAVEAEQVALTEDIQANDQRDPIVLWRGQVVDGRCRQQSLVTLGKVILYKELGDELTEDEVAVFVKSVNTRRSLTSTQKAMSASKSKLSGRDKRPNVTIAKAWAIGKHMFSDAKYIWTQDTAIAEALFNGLSVGIVDDKGRATTSSAVTAVRNHLKRLEEQVPTAEEDYDWDANSYITTQAGKDWFYETISKVKGNNQAINKLIGELANHKFQAGTVVSPAEFEAGVKGPCTLEIRKFPL